MDRENFDRKYTNCLNPQQREAVHAVEGAVLLLAVPGSGKTTTLVTRLGYMLCCCGIAADKILTTTYTVAATEEMRRKFTDQFGDDCPQIPEFRTINGLSAKIIDYYTRTHGRRQAFTLENDEGRLAKLVSDLYYEICGEFAAPSAVKELRRWIAYVKNSMLNNVEIDALETGMQQFPELYRRYCTALKSRCCMDYDDQMVYAKIILERYEDVLTYFQNRYPYLCVDESQDTSKIQHAIIRLLSHKTGNIFMVGDEDQSIYGFRAAYPDALMRFERTYPHARVLLMEENYRSTPEILRVADAFIRNNTNRRPKTLRPTRPSGAAVQIVHTADRKTQFDYLLDVAQHQEGGLPAVLFRNNDSALPLIDRLERAGIPYCCKQIDTAFFTHRIVADMADILHFAHNGKDGACFMRIYYKFDCGISRAAAEHACKQSRNSGRPILEELLRSTELSYLTRKEVNALSESFSLLLRDTAKCGLERIRGEMGYDAFVALRKLDTNKLEILSLLAEQETDLDGLMARLNRLQELISVPQRGGNPRLLLSTIHSSKGLEYDTVYLLDVLDGILPVLTEPEDEETRKQYEEERRLFYVAITRAKNELYLFCCLEQGSVFVDEVRGVLQQEISGDTVVFVSSSTGLYRKKYWQAVRDAGEKAERRERNHPNRKRLSRPVDKTSEEWALEREAAVKREEAARRSERHLTQEDEKNILAGAVPHRLVTHNKFGIGYIVDVEAPYVSIQFASVGLKKFDLLHLMRRGLLQYGKD